MAGELRPKSKFLGNSVATIMEGENRVFFFDRPEDGGKTIRDQFGKEWVDEGVLWSEYVLELPNMYARGILFGWVHEFAGIWFFFRGLIPQHDIGQWSSNWVTQRYVNATRPECPVTLSSRPRYAEEIVKSGGVA